MKEPDRPIVTQVTLPEGPFLELAKRLAAEAGIELVPGRWRVFGHLQWPRSVQEGLLLSLIEDDVVNATPESGP